MKKAADGTCIELTRSVIMFPACRVSYLNFIPMSYLMCNSVLLSAVFPMSFVSVNISLQNLGVFCPTFFLLLLIVRNGEGKGKFIPVQALKAPRRLRLPESLDNRHMKVGKFVKLMHRPS